MGAILRGRVTWIMVCTLAGLSIFHIPSPGAITFERTYGGTQWDMGYSVQQTEDGGYVVAGYTYFFGAGWSDVYLVKTDSVGDTIWSRTYGGASDEWGESVQQTQDGGYVIAGVTWSFGAGAGDVYVLRTDSEGDTVWTKTYGGILDDSGSCVQQTQDGGYIVAGVTWSFGVGGGDVYLVKTDSVGDTMWTKTYGGAGWDLAKGVQQTLDGGFIIAGVTESFGAGYRDVYLIKTDSVGDTIWTRTYGGTNEDWGYSVQQTQDGGYIVAGYTWSFGAGGYDVYLVKTGPVGDTMWTSTYGGPGWQWGYSVHQTQDGGYVVAGENFDAYLIRTDSVGDTLWTRNYGGNNWDLALSVRQTDDGGYVIVGWTECFGAGYRDVYLIKTDENGLTGIEQKGTKPAVCPRSFRLLQNSPNPLQMSTLISYSLPQVTEVTLTIYDITGRLVERLVNQTQQPGIHQVRWDRRTNPSGVYFYRLKACPEPGEGRGGELAEPQSRRAGEFVETRKMVVVE